MNPYINLPPFLKHLSKGLDEFCSMPVKVVGKRPIYKLVREYAKCEHLIIDSLVTFNSLELQTLKKINRQVKEISENKCTYYDTAPFGLLKRIYSCFLNAMYFGRFASSGSLGLTLSAKLAEQIENR